MADPHDTPDLARQLGRLPLFQGARSAGVPLEQQLEEFRRGSSVADHS